MVLICPSNGAVVERSLLDQQSITSFGKGPRHMNTRITRNRLRALPVAFALIFNVLIGPMAPVIGPAMNGIAHARRQHLSAAISFFIARI